jgi:hypothetical protein
MSATYHIVLDRDLDWVRFLTGDTDVTSASVTDEEITAILAEEPNKYLAAARVAMRISVMGGDIVSKSVGALSITYGGSSEEAYAKVIQDLREKGAEVELKKSGSHVFRVL